MIDLPHLHSLLQATAFMAVIAVLASWIASRLGFFRIGKPGPDVTIHGLAVIIVFVMYLILSALGPLFAAMLLKGISKSIRPVHPTLFAITWAIFISQLMIVTFIALFSMAKQSINTAKIIDQGPHAFWRNVGIGAAVWFVGYPTVSAVEGVFEALNLYVFGIEGPKQVAVEFMLKLLQYPQYLWVGVIITAIMAPLIEEFIFRGCLQTYLRRKMPRIRAIVVSSIVFAAAHFSLSQGIANIPLLAAIFSFGLFLGYTYERQRSLWASIALHAAFNGIAIARMIVMGGV